MTLRIGLVTSEFPPDLGGVETYAWQLAKALGERPDLHVTVYAPHKAAGVTPPKGVTIKPMLSSCIGLDWPRLAREPIDVWHALSAAHGWLALKAPTVVSVHGNDFLAPYPLTARPALDFPALRLLRSVAWRHLKPLWRRRTKARLRKALPRAASIISNSHYTAEVLAQHYPGCAKKIQVAWVGVDDRFCDIPRPPREPRPQLLTVCRLSEARKNVDRVLHALAALKDRHEFEYVVAGDGSLRGELQELAASLGLGGRVRFVGRVSDAALRDLYSKADLFVLTSSIGPDSHEGFGIVYLEAAASGVPSLAARLAGAAEAVAEGRSGFFVESTEVDAIANALDQFLGGGVSFEAEACRDFARGFDWKRIASRCTEAYHASHNARTQSRPGAPPHS